MPTMTCHPGQGGTVACANAPVVLRPISGSFPVTPSTLYLCSEGGEGPMGLPIPDVTWKPDQIVAQIPSANPGTGEDDETFWVQFTSGGQTWKTSDDDPVLVIGPAGNYPDPPMHTATAESTSEGLVLQPVTADFASPGEVLLFSDGERTPASIRTWSEDRIVLNLPDASGEGRDAVRIVIATSAGHIFATHPVSMLAPADA